MIDFLPPIVERDLRMAIRKYDIRKRRMQVAYFAAGFTAFTLVLNMFFQSVNGALLHLLLFGGIIVLGVIPAMSQVSTALVEERQSQNLGLLFLAGLKPGEIIAGKLAGIVLVNLQLLAGCLPFLAIPAFLGGISLKLYFASLMSIGVIFIFALALGTLASVIANDTLLANRVAVGMALFLCLTTPIIYQGYRWFSGTTSVPNFLLWFSPAYGPFVIGSKFSGGTSGNFYFNCVWTLLLSALILGIAIIWLLIVWKDENAIDRWKNRAREFLYGTRAHRLDTARYWLDRNASGWLREHDRKPVLLAWAILWGYVALWLICWALWPLGWAGPGNFYLSAILLYVAIYQCVTTATAQRIADDRRSGALQMLLTTPLSVHEIVDGQLDGTQRQFEPVWKALIGLEIVMMFAGYFTRATWQPAAFFIYLLCWAFLLWCATYPLRHRPKSHDIWLAMNYGRVIVINPNVIPMFAIQFGIHGFRLARGGPPTYQFPTGHYAEVIIVIIVLIIFATAIAANFADTYRERLLNYFREIAEDPVPQADDPRLKTWDAKSEYPLTRFEGL